MPLLVHFNIELKELKEIVTQSLRGRIFTNKEGNVIMNILYFPIAFD